MFFMIFLAITCQTLGPPTNGSNDCGASSNFGHQCNFTCDTGFYLNGSSSSKCIANDVTDANGDWRNPLPTCEGINDNIFCYKPITTLLVLDQMCLI